jgi:hypothetical protein
MRFRTLALGITAVGLLAVGTATPSPAAPIKKFEGTIAAPVPVVGFELGSMEDFCPSGGAADGSVYRFFDLKADFKHFYVSGPASTLNQPLPGDPSGLGVLPGGTLHDYDIDLHAFDAKCRALAVEGPINTANGIGAGTSAKPARYVAVSYFTGPHPNIKVLVEASTEKIVKK